MSSRFKRFLKKVAKPVAIIAAIVYPPLIPMIGTALGATTVASAAIVGAAALSTGASLVSGDSLEDALKSGVIAGATAGLGQLSSGVTSGLADALGGGSVANIAANALTGGTIAEITGGDFAQGALISGISSGINEAKLSLASNYLDSLPGGYGEYSDAPPDMSGFDLPPALADISDFPVQNFGVPIDVDTDFYRNPTSTAYSQNNDGTMSYTWDDGSTITADRLLNIVNFTPTTDDVFVAPETLAPEQTPEQAQVDIDTELGLLNAAKTLAPLAVGSLLANEVINQPEQRTGFDIVPIPEDWRSPEYNMAFTPSAPIDFGNVGMLAGTQFANQPQAASPSFYNLSDLINTLNYQSVPFVQQQYQMPQQSFSVPDILQQFQTNPNVGMNDIIGNLDGSPVTLNSIIAGIQSQYG
jgi:hypothetical protein